jgi:hypothetical protein
MSKARDLANAGTALGAVTATELAFVDGVTSAIQTQIDTKAPSSTAVTLTGTQTLTNKTLTSPAIASPTITGTLTAGGSAGTAGQFLQSTGTGVQYANVSTGDTWTGRFSSNTLFEIKRIAYNGSLYVAVGGDGSNSICLTSPTGTTWTERTSQFGSTAINAVVYDSTNSLWIIAGDSGKISTSPNGITWTARTANFSTNSIRDLATNAGTTVAVGDGGGTTDTGGITYSTNGTTWTRKSQTPTVGTSYNSVVYNGTNWVVGASNSTNNHLYASDPSSTWTAGTTGVSSTCYIIGWDGTRHITRETTNNNHPLRYSTSTTLGTTTELTNFSTADAANINVKSRTNLYNSKVYTASGLYYTNVSTTPSDTNFLYGQINRQFTPAYSGNTAPTIYCYNVFSTGQIMVVNQVLYTSF